MMAEKSAEASDSATATPSSVPSTPSEPQGNWWDSWLTTAKTKSAEVYSMVKKDLDEIGSAVKTEATHVLSSTSNVIGKTLKLDEPESPANVMKKSFSSFIGQMNTVLNPQPDDEDDTEVILSSGDTTMLSTYKKELEALQRVDATFIVPAESSEFDAWRASLETSDIGVISVNAAARRLDTNPVLKQQYDRLVPDAVAHGDFWERYLFRVALLQDRLAAASRKQTVTEPSTDPVMANLPLQTPLPPIIDQSPKKVLSGIETDPPYETPSPDIEVAWEEEDFAHDLELSEEQQTLLLEEYEREIANKTKKTTATKQTSSKDITNNNSDKTTNTTIKDIRIKDQLNNKQSPKKKSPKAQKRSPQKSPKSDVCGNNLVEDYFGEKEKEIKDDVSANSDESWEKEFDIEDVKKA